MPSTRPSVDSDVLAGCIEHPSISSQSGATLQSGTVLPLDSVVFGLNLVTMSLQNDGNISTPPFRWHKVDSVYLLSQETESLKV